MTPGKHPWYRFGFHSWVYGVDEETRNIMRSANQNVWLMGTFEARETRTCESCGRSEQRDIYGGNYIPHGWILRRYKP